MAAYGAYGMVADYYPSPYNRSGGVSRKSIHDYLLATSVYPISEIVFIDFVEGHEIRHYCPNLLNLVILPEMDYQDFKVFYCKYCGKVIVAL